MANQHTRNTLKIIVVVILFVAIFTGLRLFWIKALTNTDPPQIVNGELDLRNWDFSKNYSITLDGEWEFYPHTWLAGQDDFAEMAPQMLYVPGNWSSVLSPKDQSPYGFGSYRLRILVDPESDEIYSIYFSSVRTSSELYMNGQFLAKSGVIGKSKETSTARNVPYSASIAANGSDEIEVIVQVTNFQDAREGGIRRSVKFGTDSSLTRERDLSMALQILVASIF